MLSKDSGIETTESETQSEEYLRILEQTLESEVSILDEDMNYLFISDSVYKTIQCDRSELQPGDSLKKCHDIMFQKGLLNEDILKKQHLSIEEQVQKNASGDVESGRMLTLGNGSTYRHIRKSLPCGKTVSIAHNVTELIEKDNLLEKALNLGDSGYWSLDLITKKYTLSRSIMDYYGEEAVKAIHERGITTILSPEETVNFKKVLKSAVAKGGRGAFVSRARSKTGVINWFETTGSIIRNEAGKPIRIEAFVKNITRQRQQAAELEKAKDEAIAASKAKSEFLANMSHEIRTPMNGILGMAELLANSDIEDRQKEFVSVINNSASALLTIINDILDFSKIEAGAFEMDPVPFDLKSSLNDVVSLLHMRAQEKNLELIINYPSRFPKGFIGDAGRIRQVVTNLLGNAVKFTEEGHITTDVDIQRNNDIAICTIKVTDTGIGISPEKLEHVFDKFTQADGSTTRVYGGTGLGLTISKHIVELMDGRMTVESTLGEGSTFSFRIPLPLDPDAKDEKFDSQLIAEKRALIVDDIEINRMLLSEQLSGWDVQSDTAIDGVDALTKIRSAEERGQPYDFLLLDFLMPGMNGQEFAQVLERTSTITAPPIIMLSSCDQPVSSSSLSAIGIESYLVKPVREARLFDTIVRTLSNPTDRQKPIEIVEELAAPCEKKPSKTEILVAEDFALNRDVVKLMLADTGFSPIFAENGQIAVDMFTAEPDRFSAVVMDVSMPVMNGYEATKLMRKFEKAEGRQPVSIIALTGHALKNDRQDCLDAGMDDYLTKPVKQNDLIDRLETYTGKAITLRQTA